MLNRSTSLALSTSILKALPGNFDTKRNYPCILYVLDENLSTALSLFDDLVYRCGLEKRTLFFNIVFNETFLPCRMPAFRVQKVV